MSSTERTLSVSVWRGNAEGGHFEDFQVPERDNQTILDVVSWVQQNLDPTLSYRYACRVGMCGSCAMMVNGKPRWTCRTHVGKVAGEDGRLEVAPLRNLPVIKDLATDMDPFFDKWVEAEGRFHPTRTRAHDVERVDPHSAARQKADAGIECINCAVCFAACDTVAGNSDYLGPAALNRAWTLLNDVKDAGRQEIIEAVSGSGGCHNCHSQGSCAVFCPNELSPITSIAGLKRETTKALFGWGG
ncbi:2Fe-2S iron-sulfur cluster-binding protein [Aurantimonas sp. VKM B-3413]|uniref:succinate dehydrogenase/fumarate reductase iron-sulfur subunit n=1 Tax=Aurantimonas sp. VKM B-3413 TaxID=2779401 RepID=UPI001E536B18|nr:4Fe-4S dicluster domain-containing protein [Aurantimonas sp. VKM B-3413]